MRHPSGWLQWISHGFLAVGLAGVSGCMGFLHPVETPPPAQVEPCQTLPKCCRDHVYVFLLNGLDPFNYANLTGLRDYLNHLGVAKTYYGQIYHFWSFTHEIRRIHKEDPEARFVLIGFSVGVNLADGVARSVQADGIHIDLLVYLSGNHPVMPMPGGRPDNVDRVVNILAAGVMNGRGQRDWAENVRLASTMHFGSPTHPMTLERLAQELTAVAATVPVTEWLPPAPPPSAEQAPTPRPVKPRPARPEGWDFLKPVAQLSKWPAPETADQPPASPPREHLIAK
jgi:hypothetical protein